MPGGPGGVAVVPIVLVVVSSKSTMRLEVELTKTANWLRGQVSRVVKRKPFWIVFKGRVLKGDWCLGTYGIHSGARLHVVLRQRIERRDSLVEREELPSKKKSQALTSALLVLLFSKVVRKEDGDASETLKRISMKTSSSQRAHRERRRDKSAEQHPLLRWERGQRGVL